MKNKKILRIFDECIEDAKQVLQEAVQQGGTECAYARGRLNILFAMKGRFEQEIEKEKEAKK
jgi:hypothetical protein